jgi:small subunit ribosomal protein S2
MKPYIFIARGGIYIIDLQKTLRLLNRAIDFMTGVAQKKGTVLFVGTKKQAKVAIRECAQTCNMPFVTERWLGGMLTNFSTIFKSVQKLEDIEAMMADGRMENFSKKEQLEINRTYEKLNRNLGGIRNMKGLPDALFVIDTAEEETAVREANKLGIPVVGIVDTNCDPNLVKFPIPGNDDAIRSINLFARTVAKAIEEGKAARLEGAEEVEIQGQPKESAETVSATLSSQDSTVAEKGATPTEAPAASTTATTTVPEAAPAEPAPEGGGEARAEEGNRG